MRRLADSLHAVILTLWVGGLWVIGYLVAPTLFSTIADRALAGVVAGKLFALIGWVGVGGGAYLLVFMRLRHGAAVWRNWSFRVLLAMWLLAAASLFGIQPLMAQMKAEALPREVMESVLRERFAVWHGISSILYLVQSLLGLWAVTAVACVKT